MAHKWISLKQRYYFTISSTIFSIENNHSYLNA
jgi:hypothetical protein